MDRDSASANLNVAMKASYLTEEQKKARDIHQESLHRALFGDNHLIGKQQQEMRATARSARTAHKVHSFDSHVAIGGSGE